MITQNTIATLARRLDQEAHAGASETLARIGKIYDATAKRTRDGARQTLLLLLSDACLARSAAVWTREIRPWDEARAREFDAYSAEWLAGAARRIAGVA